MTVLVQPVALEFVNKVWQLAEQYIASAIGHQDDYTLEQVKQNVTNGIWRLIVIVEGSQVIGALTINYYNMPNDRVAFISFLGGRGIGTKEVMQGIKDIVLDNGATCIEGSGRPAIVRLWKQQFGAKEKYSIMRLKLEA